MAGKRKHASALSRYEYGSLDWIGFTSRNRHIFGDKTAGAVLGARGELVASSGERRPTGNKFGTLPSSHDAVVQNNPPAEFQGSDVARRQDFAPSRALLVWVDMASS